MADLTSMLSGGIFEPLSIGTVGLTIDTNEADVKKGAILKYNTGDSNSVQHGGDDASAIFAGIALENGAEGETIQVATEGIFGPYTHADGSLTAANINDVVCMGADDNTVTSIGTGTNDVVIGVIYSVPSATTCMVLVGQGLVGAINHGTSGGSPSAALTSLSSGSVLGTANDVQEHVELVSQSGVDGALYVGAAATGLLTTSTTLRAQLNEICTTAVDGSAKIGSGAHGVVTGANVGAQLGVIATHIASTKGMIQLPILAWQLTDGTALAKFSNGDSATPGYTSDGSEAIGIKWNNYTTAAPTPIATSFVWPLDADTTADAYLKVIGYKSGATAGDTIDLIITAHNNVVGSLYDADNDYATTDIAFNDTATAKTVQIGSATLAAADLPVPNTNMATTRISIAPTDGKIETDDFCVTGAYIQYTKKLLTA